jgi:hypothetical protein
VLLGCWYKLLGWCVEDCWSGARNTRHRQLRRYFV